MIQLALQHCSIEFLTFWVLVIHYAGLPGQIFPRVSTLPPEILSSYKPDQFSSQLKLERSKTDRPRRNDLRPEEAAQFYDEKISVQQKVKSLYAHWSYLARMDICFCFAWLNIHSNCLADGDMSIYFLFFLIGDFCIITSNDRKCGKYAFGANDIK